jgi:hypothetical protein
MVVLQNHTTLRGLWADCFSRLAQEKNVSNGTNEITDRPQHATRSPGAVFDQIIRPASLEVTLDQAASNASYETNEITDEQTPGSFTSPTKNLTINSTQFDLKPENLRLLEDTPQYGLDFWCQQDRKDDCWSVFSSTLDQCLYKASSDDRNIWQHSPNSSIPSIMHILPTGIFFPELKIRIRLPSNHYKTVNLTFLRSSSSPTISSTISATSTLFNIVTGHSINWISLLLIRNHSPKPVY